MVQEREQTTQDFTVVRVCMVIIECQCFYGKSLVYFIPSSGSTRTYQGQEDWKAEFLRTIVGSVFNIDINIFPF